MARQGAWRFNPSRRVHLPSSGISPRFGDICRRTAQQQSWRLPHHPGSLCTDLLLALLLHSTDARSDALSGPPAHRLQDPHTGRVPGGDRGDTGSQRVCSVPPVTADSYHRPADKQEPLMSNNTRLSSATGDCFHTIRISADPPIIRSGTVMAVASADIQRNCNYWG